MSDDWYLYKDNKAQGPLSESQVRGALAAGRIKPDTPLRKGLSGPWTPAERVLAESVVAATPARRKPSAPSTGEINVVIERPSRLPLALAVVAGVVVLFGVLWGAFELGRRQPGPVTAAAHQDQVPTRQDAPVLGDKAQPSTPAATQSAIQPSAHQALAEDESDPAKPSLTKPPAAPPAQLRSSAKPNQSTLPDSNTNVASTAGDPHPAVDAKSNLEAASSPLEHAARKREKQAPQPPKPANLDKPTPRVADAGRRRPSPRLNQARGAIGCQRSTQCQIRCQGRTESQTRRQSQRRSWCPRRRPRMPMCGPSK